MHHTHSIRGTQRRNKSSTKKTGLSRRQTVRGSTWVEGKKITGDETNRIRKSHVVVNPFKSCFDHFTL